MIQDMNIDPLIGAHLFKTLQVSLEEMTDNNISNKMKDIVDFVSQLPDPLFVIDSVPARNRGGKMSNLDFLYTFVQLNKQRDEAQQRLSEIDKQLEFYG